MSSIIPTCRSSSCIDGVVPSGRRRQCRRPGGLGPRGCAIEGGIAGGIEGGPAVREGEKSVAGRSASGIPYARKLKVPETLVITLSLDRKSVVQGTRVAVRVDLGGRCIINKKNKKS